MRAGDTVKHLPMSNGELWSIIRRKLPDLREQIKAAVEAKQYEIESAYFDGIARELADAITKERDDDRA